MPCELIDSSISILCPIVHSKVCANKPLDVGVVRSSCTSVPTTHQNNQWSIYTAMQWRIGWVRNAEIFLFPSPVDIPLAQCYRIFRWLSATNF